MLFLHDPEQWSIMLMNILNVYAVVMNIIGLKRLAKEERNET